MASSTQASNAVRFYTSRAQDYDSTWHTAFTQRFLTHVPIKPGSQILDLACGTGLLTFLLSTATGSAGHVTGVEITPSMLAEASRKKRQAGETYANVTLLEADVLNLDAVAALQGKTFDVITIASALVLFPDPHAAIEHWATFLKPGGVLVADATHPRNLVSGMVLEQTARRLGLQVPYNRSWSQSENSLQHVLESAGLQAEKIVTIEDQAGWGRRFHDVESWDDHFVENVIMKDVWQTFATNDVRKKAQGIFKEEWEKLAVEGKVEEVDSVFLGVARKPADGSRYISTTAKQDVVFKGGCRCGGVTYTATASPSHVTNCYCRACQQVSGSDYLPFIYIPLADLNLTSTLTLKTLRLTTRADRTFCTGCGAPISMLCHDEPDRIYLVAGSLDMESLGDTALKLVDAIYVHEKPPWVVVPEFEEKK